MKKKETGGSEEGGDEGSVGKTGGSEEGGDGNGESVGKSGSSEEAMPTPNSCLKVALDSDPKLGGKEESKRYILDVARDIKGCMNLDEVEKYVKSLDIKKKNLAASRVCDLYGSKVQKELNEDPDLRREDVWQRFLQKEHRAPDPEEAVSEEGEFEEIVLVGAENGSRKRESENGGGRKKERDRDGESVPDESDEVDLDVYA